MTEIKGTVLREDSLSPIYGVVIYNKNSLLGTLSNKLGNFRMRIKTGDTIVVSHIGFTTSILIFDDTKVAADQKINIVMKIRSYELPGIDVRRFRIRERAPVPITMKRTDNKTYDMGTIYYHGGRMYNLGTNTYLPTGVPYYGMMPSFGIPIGDWSAARRQKQIEKVAMLEAADRRKRFVSQKYNRGMVNKLTGLKGNELENFMNFCKPTDKAIYEANEYELTYYILDCYEKFRIDNE